MELQSRDGKILCKFAASNVFDKLRTMKLYVFNPDTDMALADNNESYMAPSSARRMAQDLALLPIWYAQPGSAVLAASAYNADYLAEMKKLFPLHVQLITEPELPEYADAQIMPWGWNRAFRRRMLKGGIKQCKLPAEEEMEEYRRLSSRAQLLGLFLAFDYVKVTKYTCGRHSLIVKEDNSDYTPEIPEIFGDSCVFKSLWSGSGKGLRWCRRSISKSTADWCKNEMKTHGALMAEPIYNKVGDFAMEFYSDGQGKVIFTGYSRFFTDEKGAYQGNLLISDEDVENWLLQYVPLEAVVCIREHLLKNLTGMYGKRYKGSLGIDMMICKDEEGLPYAIHPHVEINMRMTMGIVSHQLYQTYVASGSHGIFTIDYYPSPETLRAQHVKNLHDYPLRVEDGRVVSGYLPLVPVTPQSCYCAYMRIQPQ